MQQLTTSWPLDGSTPAACAALGRWRACHPELPDAESPTELVARTLRCEPATVNAVLRVLLVEAGHGDEMARRTALALVSPTLGFLVGRCLERVRTASALLGRRIVADDLVAELVADACAVLDQLAVEVASVPRVWQWPLTMFWSRVEKLERRRPVVPVVPEEALTDEVAGRLEVRPRGVDPASELVALLADAVSERVVTRAAATALARHVLFDESLEQIGDSVGPCGGVSLRARQKQQRRTVRRLREYTARPVSESDAAVQAGA